MSVRYKRFIMKFTEAFADRFTGAIGILFLLFITFTGPSDFTGKDRKRG
jgi:hypothetical protein